MLCAETEYRRSAHGDRSVMVPGRVNVRRAATPEVASHSRGEFSPGRPVGGYPLSTSSPGRRRPVHRAPVSGRQLYMCAAQVLGCAVVSGTGSHEAAWRGRLPDRVAAPGVVEPEQLARAVRGPEWWSARTSQIRSSRKRNHSVPRSSPAVEPRAFELRVAASHRSLEWRLRRLARARHASGTTTSSLWAARAAVASSAVASTT